MKVALFYNNENVGDVLIIKGSDEILKSLKKKPAGFRVLASLSVFAIIYRYATPVLITPVANWIGDKYNARLKAKREAKVA